jgi:hypothetical protein
MSSEALHLLSCCSLWDKRHYFFKLLPPRPTYPRDMMDKEGLLMKD